jgi:hypothetical protein
MTKSNTIADIPAKRRASSSKDIRLMLKDEKVKDEINFVWLNPGFRKNKFKFDFTPIASFVTACSRIRNAANLCEKYDYGEGFFFDMVKECFDNIDESDPLCLEKMFVRAVTSSDGEYLSDMSGKGYEPADDMLRTGSCSMGSWYFRCKDPLQNAQCLGEYIVNLDKYVD